MLITDQVAIAPCTDCVQARRPTFVAKPVEGLKGPCTKSADTRIRAPTARNMIARGKREARRPW